MNRAVRAVLGWAVLLASASCAAPSTPPEGVVFQWLHAFAAQDGTTIARLTCAASRADNQNARLLQMALGVQASYPGGGGGGGGQFLSGGGGGPPTYDVSGLQYATTFVDERTARVQVTGQLRMASGLATQSLRMNGSVPLMREQDQWRVCDASGG